MTLGEALTLRSKQAQRLAELRARVQGSVVIQEGDEPSEDVPALILEFNELSIEHRNLIALITETNTKTVVGERTLLGHLQERDHMIRMRGLYKAAADATGLVRQVRYGRAEIKFVATIDATQMREEEQLLDEAVRRLDALIQKTNWETEL